MLLKYSTHYPPTALLNLWSSWYYLPQKEKNKIAFFTLQGKSFSVLVTIHFC